MSLGNHYRLTQHVDLDRVGGVLPRPVAPGADVLPRVLPSHVLVQDLAAVHVGAAVGHALALKREKSIYLWGNTSAAFGFPPNVSFACSFRNVHALAATITIKLAKLSCSNKKTFSNFLGFFLSART